MPQLVAVWTDPHRVGVGIHRHGEGAGLNGVINAIEAIGTTGSPVAVSGQGRSALHSGVEIIAAFVIGIAAEGIIGDEAALQIHVGDFQDVALTVY